MKLAATVIYADDSEPVLEFHQKAFGLAPGFVDLDVQLPGGNPGPRYQFASIETDGGTLQFGTHALGALLIPSTSVPPPGGPPGSRSFSARAMSLRPSTGR